MEKEKILSTMREKLGKTNFSDDTINMYIDNHLPAEGEPDDSFFDKGVNFLKSLQGQFNHDMVAEVEKIKAGNKNHHEDPPKEEFNKLFDEQQKKIQELEDEMKSFRSKSIKDNFQKRLIAEGDKLNVSNKSLWKDTILSMEISEDAKDEDLVSSAKNAYEDKLKRYVGDGVQPYGGVSTPGGGAHIDEAAAKERREAFIAKKRAEGRLPKQDAN